MNDLAALETFASGLVSRLAPTERRRLARDLAAQLRKSQSRRIGDQLNPDGSAYAPRKPQQRRKKGSLRRRMFSKLRTTRFLKVRSSPDAAIITFAAQVQAMAQVHQHGLRDRVNRRRGPEIDYPARQLLGFTTPEITAIEDAILAHLAG